MRARNAGGSDCFCVENGSPICDATFAQVCAVVHGQVMDHRKGTTGPQRTLNRLFQGAVGKQRLPWLAPNTVHFKLVDCKLDHLIPIARDTGEWVPFDIATPIVVIHFHGRDYLIDGSKRIRYWHQHGATTMPAYVGKMLVERIEGAAAVRQKYQGKRASDYDNRRMAKQEWQREQDAVAALLAGLPRGATVLDIPVGTGRFVPLYRDLGLRALGIDTSPDMLAIADSKIAAAGIEMETTLGDILDLDAGTFDAVICARLLNWFLADEMQRAVHNIIQSASRRAIVSIRLDKGRRHHKSKVFEAAVDSAGATIGRVIAVGERGYKMVEILP